MDWQQYKKEFDSDNDFYGLQSLYILNVNLSNWQKLLDFLNEEIYKVVFYKEGITTLLPLRIEPIFIDMTNIAKYVSVHVDSLTAHCYFQSEDFIEFDIDPSEIKTEKHLNSLFEFMRKLGTLLNKEVILTPSNSPKQVIFRYLFFRNEIIHYPAEYKNSHTI